MLGNVNLLLFYVQICSRVSYNRRSLDEGGEIEEQMFNLAQMFIRTRNV